jgi:hypothetical protein
VADASTVQRRDARVRATGGRPSERRDEDETSSSPPWAAFPSVHLCVLYNVTDLNLWRDTSYTHGLLLGVALLGIALLGIALRLLGVVSVGSTGLLLGVSLLRVSLLGVLAVLLLLHDEVKMKVKVQVEEGWGRLLSTLLAVVWCTVGWYPSAQRWDRGGKRQRPRRETKIEKSKSKIKNRKVGWWECEGGFQG